MSITFVNSQGTSFNTTSVNVDTSGLSLGDVCFVYIAKQSNNITVTPPAGWIVLEANATKLHSTFAKPMAVGGDITVTNTFSFPNGRGAMIAIAFRGANPNNILTQHQGAIQAATHVPTVDWPALSTVPSGSVFIGFVDSFDASGNFIGTIPPLPSGYTDSGQGDLGYGSGTPHDIRLFYAIGVSGSVDPPDTAPGGGFASDFGYTSGSFDIPPTYLGVAPLTGDGDLSLSGATTTSVGVASLSGLGDIAAFSDTPLCQFAYIAYDYAGAFFCLNNLGNFVTPIGSNVQDICIVDC